MVRKFWYRLTLHFFDKGKTRDCVHSFGHSLVSQIFWHIAARTVGVASPPFPTSSCVRAKQASVDHCKWKSGLPSRHMSPDVTRRLETNEVEWIGKPESRKAEFLAAGEACNTVFQPTPAGLNEGPIERPVFSAKPYSPIVPPTSPEGREGRTLVSAKWSETGLTASVLKKRSQTHKRLKERFWIGRNRAKRANFRGSPLFQATYNIKREKLIHNITCFAALVYFVQREVMC